MYFNEKQERERESGAPHVVSDTTNESYYDIDNTTLITIITVITIITTIIDPSDSGIKHSTKSQKKNDKEMHQMRIVTFLLYYYMIQQKILKVKT